MDITFLQKNDITEAIENLLEHYGSGKMKSLIVMMILDDGSSILSNTNANYIETLGMMQAVILETDHQARQS